MGNAPRTGNPYAVGGAPPAGGNNTFSDFMSGGMPNTPYDRDGMAAQMAGRPPSTKSPRAMTTAPAVRAAGRAPLAAQQPATIAAAPMLTPTPTPTPAPAATPAAAPALPAVAPSVAAGPSTTPLTAPSAVPNPTPVIPKPATPAKPATTAATTTPAKPATAAPKVVAEKPPTVAPVTTNYPAALQAAAGQVWSPEQVKAGGRWEMPAGAPKGAIGRNWVKYAAPAPAAAGGRNDLAAQLAAAQARYPGSHVSTGPTGQPQISDPYWKDPYGIARRPGGANSR